MLRPLLLLLGLSCHGAIACCCAFLHSGRVVVLPALAPIPQLPQLPARGGMHGDAAHHGWHDVKQRRLRCLHSMSATYGIMVVAGARGPPSPCTRPPGKNPASSSPAAAGHIWLELSGSAVDSSQLGYAAMRSARGCCACMQHEVSTKNTCTGRARTLK